jgi:hypothetical protein
MDEPFFLAGKMQYNIKVDIVKIQPLNIMEAENTVLSQKALKRCRTLAERDDIHGQRAWALVAYHEGATRREAGEASGLTMGQVKYALERFRTLGLDMFAGIDEIAEEVSVTETESEKEAPEDKPTREKKSKKGAKEAKSKKEKKSKKKDKKAKSKKEKKSKKKEKNSKADKKSKKKSKKKEKKDKSKKKLEKPGKGNKSK